MLTTKCVPSWKAGRLCAYSELLHSTKGGFSDTELKELAVMPCGVPSRSRVVMIVTPVAKEPSALRNSRVLKPSAEVLCTSAWWLPGRSFDTAIPRTRYIVASGERPSATRPYIAPLMSQFRSEEHTLNSSHR